ncbi:MAG: hypothetical protein H0X36_07390 [Sphingomonadaceae bacterium]|nr:hypothetical protein [Sphingomonadaceae bacterium]
MLKPIFIATAIAGTLDILAAAILTLLYGRPVYGMLRSVASGPFPNATDWGAGGALLGLATHFTLMAIMVVAFFIAADRFPALRASPIKWGVIYGLVTYLAMNLIVVPLRFHAWPPKPVSIATQLFCHIVLVGIPIALVAARYYRGRLRPY